MALWIRTDGTTTVVEPGNGTDFTLLEVKKFIGGGYLEVIGIPGGRLMVLDEDGKRKEFAVNEVATALARPVLLPGDVIVGDVLVCARMQIK
jgi:hypothetical protein